MFHNNNFAISLQYLKKKVSNKDKYEDLLQIDTMFLMVMVKHSQSYRNSKFAVSLPYLKREVTGDVDFLHADNA